MIDVITVCLSRAFPAIFIANHVGMIPGDKVADVHNLIVTIFFRPLFPDLFIFQ